MVKHSRQDRLQKRRNNVLIRSYKLSVNGIDVVFYLFIYFYRYLFIKFSVKGAQKHHFTLLVAHQIC